MEEIHTSSLLELNNGGLDHWTT